MAMKHSYVKVQFNIEITETSVAMMKFLPIYGQYLYMPTTFCKRCLWSVSTGMWNGMVSVHSNS